MSKRWWIWLVLNLVTLFAFPYWYTWDNYEQEGQLLAAGKITHDTPPELSLYASSYFILILLAGLNVVVLVGHGIKWYIHKKRARKKNTPNRIEN